MNFLQYQDAAMRTAKPEDEPLVDNLVHASLGISTEAGEFISEVKRIARYGKEMTPEIKAHMLEELGDVLWYVALGCTALSANMNEVASANIVKLLKRFPGKFSNELAEKRLDKGGLPHTES